MTSPHEVRAAGVIPAGAARMIAFPSRLRAEKVTRNGLDYIHIHGVASAYEQPYEMWDIAGPYKETVGEGAGADSLAQSPDVAFLLNHKGATMARTANERRPMELHEQPDGLHVDAWVNPTRSDVRDMVTAIDDGDITEMSFAFMITDGQWNDDFTEYRIKAYDIDRGDVSVVNYGANPYTSVAARSREIIADLDRLPVGAARAALERLQHRPDLTQTPAMPADQTGSRELVKVGRSISLVLAQLALDED
jgi:HK97 family phage prohead protease